MTAYNNMDNALAGLLCGLDHDKISRVVTVDCAFGAPAYLPSGDGDTAHSTSTAGLVPDGVFVRTQKYPGLYENKDVANIVRKGLVYVPVSDAVVANAPLYITPAGVWTDETSGNTACKGKFRSTTSGAGLALVELFDN